MTSPNDIRKFSERWLDLFDWFEENPTKEHIIETESAKRAHSVRFAFYRARSAMQRDPGLRQLYPQADRREVILDDNKVVFRIRENAPLSELLENSLKEAK